MGDNNMGAAGAAGVGNLSPLPSPSPLRLAANAAPSGPPLPPLSPTPVTPNTRPWYRRFMNTMKRKGSNALKYMKYMKQKVTNYFDPKYAYARALANANSSNDRLTKARNITQSYYKKRGKGSLPVYLTRSNANARSAAANFFRENPFWGRKMRGVRKTIQRRFGRSAAKVGPEPGNAAVSPTSPHQINANLERRANIREGERLKKEIEDIYATLNELNKHEEGKHARNATLTRREADIKEQKKQAGISGSLLDWVTGILHRYAFAEDSPEPVDFYRQERDTAARENALVSARIGRLQGELAGKLGSFQNLRRRIPTIGNAPNDPREKYITDEKKGDLMATATELEIALLEIKEQKITPLLKVITEHGIKDETALLQRGQFNSPVTITIKYIKDLFEECLNISKAIRTGQKLRTHVRNLRKCLENINQIIALAPTNQGEYAKLIAVVLPNVVRDLTWGGMVLSARTKIPTAVEEFTDDSSGTLTRFIQAYQRMNTLLPGLPE